MTGEGALTRTQRLWVAVLGAGPSAILGGVAAAIDGGLRHLRSDRVDVLVPPRRAYADLLRRLPPDLPAVFVHRTAALPDEHRQIGLPNRTSMPRSIVDAASWARTDHEARKIIAMSCQQRLVTSAELLPADRCLGPGALPGRVLLVLLGKDAGEGSAARLVRAPRRGAAREE